MRIVANNLIRFGCAAVSTQFEESILQPLLAECMQYQPTKRNLRGGDGLRYSLNNEKHVHSKAWRATLEALMSNRTFTNAVSNWVAVVDKRMRWFFYDFGGDVVLPQGPGEKLHSDYWGARLHVFAVSVAVADYDPLAAPLRVIPGMAPSSTDYQKWSPPEEFAEKVLLKKGDIFIHDVNVWHSGTANHTTTPRYLPMVRFATMKVKLPLSYKTLENHRWLWYWGDASLHVQQVMQLKWRRDVVGRERTIRDALWRMVGRGYLDANIATAIARTCKSCYLCW